MVWEVCLTTHPGDYHMSITAITLIFVAAMAHASWNLFSKQASTSGATRFSWLLAAGASLAYAPVVAVAIAVGHPHLKALNWVFLAGTGLLQSAYFLLLQSGYRFGDLSVAYPIGRGSGALFATIGGVVLLGERPGLVTATGIAAITIGVVAIGLPGRQAAGLPGASDPAAEPPGQASQPVAAPAQAPIRTALAFALATGVFIAAYTIWDKYAVATLHTPPLLQGYAAFPVMTVVLAPFALRDADRLRQVWRTFRPQVIGAALLAPLAYILVLIALSFTAVSVVAPAREISVLFGIVLGRRLLGEANLARRLAAGTAIVAGIIAIAIG
jgi:drug/metabolite transporter (DMT)-like permease